MIRKNTFPKKEHLCGEIRVGKLFSEGKAFIVYPLRVVYKVLPESSDIPVKVLVSVPKKRFKHAVDRNRIKRLMRESYRLSKMPFVDAVALKSVSVQIAFNYVADSETDFATLKRKMEKALLQISQKL